MQRPTSARPTDVGRIPGSWPFLPWCFVAGVLVFDVDLLGARTKGNHFRAWGKVHHEEVARVAQQLGWAPAWTHQVCETQLPMVCLTSAKTFHHLDADLLDHFATELADAPMISANHRRLRSDSTVRAARRSSPSAASLAALRSAATKWQPGCWLRLLSGRRSRPCALTSVGRHEDRASSQSGAARSWVARGPESGPVAAATDLNLGSM